MCAALKPDCACIAIGHSSRTGGVFSSSPSLIPSAWTSGPGGFTEMRHHAPSSRGPGGRCLTAPDLFRSETGDTFSPISAATSRVSPTAAAFAFESRDGARIDISQNSHQDFSCSFIPNLMAFAAGHSVVMADLDGKTRSVVEFNRTPTTVPVVDQNTILALLNGAGEIRTGPEGSSVSVPGGRPVAYQSLVFLVETKVWQARIACWSERVSHFPAQGWEEACARIKAVNDVPNLENSPRQVIRSGQFVPMELSDV
jgi:hypothetical protein